VSILQDTADQVPDLMRKGIKLGGSDEFVSSLSGAADSLPDFLSSAADSNLPESFSSTERSSSSVPSSVTIAEFSERSSSGQDHHRPVAARSPSWSSSAAPTTNHCSLATSPSSGSGRSTPRPPPQPSRRSKSVVSSEDAKHKSSERLWWEVAEP
jgi:hypothetical protein